MPTRAYLRFDPAWYDRKVLGITAEGEPIKGFRPYPPDALVAFLGCLDLAEQQPKRGWFRSERVLRELLRGSDGRGQRYARAVVTLIERGDLIEHPGGRLYVDGWDQWQEGDWKVAERVARIRAKGRSVTNGVTGYDTPGVTVPTVSSLSDGGRLSGGGGGSYSGSGAPYHGDARPSLSPTQRRTNLEASLQAAQALLDDPETKEKAREVAARAVADAEAKLAALEPEAPASEAGDAQPEEVDFTEPRAKKAPASRSEAAADA